MKKLIIIGLLMCVALLAGCQQYGAPGDNKVNFIEMNEELLCVMPLGMEKVEDKNFFINSNEEYQKQMELVKGPKCKDFSLPDIDFEEYTLLGKYAQGGGCSIDFKKTIWRDDSKKTIRYNIKVIEKGLCDMLGMSMNWVLVPKIPEDYEIVFNVIE